MNPFQMCGRKIVKTHARKHVRRDVLATWFLQCKNSKKVSRNSHVPEDLLQALSMDQALIFVTGFVVDVGMDPLHAILN